LAWIAVAPASRADPAGETRKAYVELAAPEGCGTREALIEGVRQRSDLVQFVDKAQAERSLIAEIQPLADGGFSAGFTLEQGNGRVSRRKVVAKSCREAFDALTLLVTLALDPLASDEPSAPPPPIPAPEPQPTATIPIQETPQAPAAALPPERVITFAAGVGGLAAWGAAPSVMPGGFLYLGGGMVSSGAWSPAIRLSAAHAERDGIEESGATAGFALNLVVLDLCPLGFVGPARLIVRACAAGSVGQLSSHGSSTREPEAHHRPFGSLGGSALLSFEPTHRLEIVATLGIAFPLFRDSFQFRNDVFFQVQPVAVAAGLGLGFRIL
jgi:hypothetical protein